jgi:hypothetical protein
MKSDALHRGEPLYLGRQIYAIWSDWVAPQVVGTRYPQV